MQPYEQSIEINAQVDKVWRVLNDVTDWNEWIPEVAKVQGVAGVVEPGAIFDLSYKVKPHIMDALVSSVMGRLPKEQIIFTDVEAPRHIGFIRKVPGMETRTSYALEQLPNDKTKITRTIGASGAVERFLSWLPGFKPSEPTPKNMLNYLKSYVERIE